MRVTVILKCNETGESYSTSKNKKNNPERLEFFKYSKKLQKRVLFKEAKR